MIMNSLKLKITPASRQITAALKRASLQAHRRAKAYGTEFLILDKLEVARKTTGKNVKSKIQ